MPHNQPNLHGLFNNTICGLSYSIAGTYHSLGPSEKFFVNSSSNQGINESARPPTKRITVAIDKAIYVDKNAESTGYRISLYYDRMLVEANFAASFEGHGDTKSLEGTEHLGSAEGITGYFMPIRCGGSCSPANLWWVQDKVLYHIQLKLTSNLTEQDQRKIITTVANSAILSGPR